MFSTVNDHIKITMLLAGFINQDSSIKYAALFCVLVNCPLSLILHSVTHGKGVYWEQCILALEDVEARLQGLLL